MTFLLLKICAKIKQELSQGFVEINFSVEKLCNIDIHGAIHSAFKAERIREIDYLFIKVGLHIPHTCRFLHYSERWWWNKGERDSWR